MDSIKLREYCKDGKKVFISVNSEICENKIIITTREYVECDDGKIRYTYLTHRDLKDVLSEDEILMRAEFIKKQVNFAILNGYDIEFI